MIPETMTIIEVTTPGDPDCMHLGTAPVPQPRAGEVLVRVAAAGVNRPDVSQRQGHYPPPPGASPIMGLEIAGEVVALGEGATLALGTKVCALANGGGYAGYCAVPQTQTLPWPTGYDAIRAAALPETFFTVWANLFDIGRLQPGETVLIHGGSSGIGTTAIQLARALGSRVFVTAGSAAKCEACLGLGAEAAINYKAENFADRIKTLTDGHGVNVVLDMIGAPYAQSNLKCLAMDGRLVLIAFLGGSKVEAFDMLTIMTKRLTVTGSTMRPRTAAQKAAIAQSLLARAWPLLESGAVAPVINAVFPMAAAPAAHRLMESSAHVGKIVMTL